MFWDKVMRVSAQFFKQNINYMIDPYHSKELKQIIIIKALLYLFVRWSLSNNSSFLHYSGCCSEHPISDVLMWFIRLLGRVGL